MTTLRKYADQTKQNSYNCVLIFKEMTNKTNFQLLAFSYASTLETIRQKILMLTIRNHTICHTLFKNRQM